MCVGICVKRNEMGALQQALDQQIHSCHDIYLTVILMMMTHHLKMMT